MDGLDAALLYQQALFLSPGDRPGDIYDRDLLYPGYRICTIDVLTNTYS